ncbi:hypothetical protein Baya_6321 [Bagarius yarrelli]|uniref:Uncharacterized protein n=1 Tax=Bagarius yarrelli TaxID=175774 RepID=A0A556TXY9_BAGYA|nr:hypothetical protein Baya_6321 [Bagarius yarrelli]
MSGKRIFVASVLASNDSQSTSSTPNQEFSQPLIQYVDEGSTEPTTDIKPENATMSMPEPIPKLIVTSEARA